MKKAAGVLSSTVVVACAAVASTALGSPAAVGETSALTGPTVTVQVKTLTKTLLAPTPVRGRKGWITKGGTPSRKCPARSAAGALDAATHGHWTGKYYASVSGIFVTSILGVKPPTSKDYWAIFVNNRSSNSGICSIKLRAGEHLRFSIVK
jgi:hypothetical protein